MVTSSGRPSMPTSTCSSTVPVQPRRCALRGYFGGGASAYCSWIAAGAVAAGPTSAGPASTGPGSTTGSLPVSLTTGSLLAGSSLARGVAGCATGRCGVTGCFCFTISTGTMTSGGMSRATRLGSRGRSIAGGGIASGIISRPKASRLSARVPLIVAIRAGSRRGFSTGASRAKPAGRDTAWTWARTMVNLLSGWSDVGTHTMQRTRPAIGVADAHDPIPRCAAPLPAAMPSRWTAPHRRPMGGARIAQARKRRRPR